jgi:uncharacterized protein involved in exopolysaccharide biosynthesis
MDNTPKSNAETENPVTKVENKRIQITIEDFIKILRDNKKLYCISSLITFAVIVFVFLFVITPVYSVNSSIEIRSTQGSTSISPFDMMSQFIGGVMSNSRSIDFELLKSRTLMDSVIQKDNLQMNVRKKNNSMFVHYWSKFFGEKAEDAFVIFKKIPEPLKVGSGEITASEDGYVIEFGGTQAECRWNEDCLLGKDTVSVEKIGSFNFPVKYKFEYESIIFARKRFAQSLLVDNAADSGALNLKKGGDAELILLVFTHESPLMSVRVLNDLIDAYIVKKSEWEKDDAESKQLYINGRLEELSLGIQEKAEKMILFQQKEHTIMPELEFPELLKKQEAMKVQQEEFKFKRKILENTLKNIEKDSGKPITLPIEESSVQEALKYHNALIFKRNELSQRVTEEHPLKVAADEEIKESESALKNVIRTSITQYDKGEKLLGELLNMMSDGQEKLPENLLVFANLKRDVELAERVYVTLSAKLYESSISPNIGILPVRVVDFPDPQVLRSFPKSVIFAAITLIATILSGFFVVFAKEFFKSAREILK